MGRGGGGGGKRHKHVHNIRMPTLLQCGCSPEEWGEGSGRAASRPLLEAPWSLGGYYCLPAHHHHHDHAHAAHVSLGFFITGLGLISWGGVTCVSWGNGALTNLLWFITFEAS